MEPNQVKQQAVLACGEVHLQLQSRPLRQAGTGNPNVSTPHANKESQSQAHRGANRLRRHTLNNITKGVYSLHIRLDYPFDFFLCLILIELWYLQQRRWNPFWKSRCWWLESRHYIFCVSFVWSFFFKPVPTDVFFLLTSLKFPFLSSTSKAIVLQCHSYTTQLSSALQKALMWNEEA